MFLRSAFLASRLCRVTTLSFPFTSVTCVSFSVCLGLSFLSPSVLFSFFSCNSILLDVTWCHLSMCVFVSKDLQINAIPFDFFFLILSDSFCACEGPTGVQVPVVLASASMAIGSGFRIKGFAPVISPRLSVHYVLTIIHCRLGSFHSSLRQKTKWSGVKRRERNKWNKGGNRNECHDNVIECPRGSGKTKTSLGEHTTFGENKVWKI